MNKPLIALKAVRELGLSQTFWYAVYQAGLRTGYYRAATPAQIKPGAPTTIRSPFVLPDRIILQNLLDGQVEGLIAEADEVAAGQVRLFGGPPVPLSLAPPDARRHWTEYEGHPAAWGVDDIKFLWEPARFGWVYPLGRAYLLNGDETYPAAFWKYFSIFSESNPPNQGPNWTSGQEVALRLVALLFAACAFQYSVHSLPDRMARLAEAVAAHATRIPPTLSYARAQNNNHRISEALGLCAAGYALRAHPQSRRWSELGWKELNRALQTQIQPDGTYAQHSMNYHRLMLHAALQALLLGRRYPAQTQKRLAAAAAWLLAQVDEKSGRAPNLGSNDGANILPLAAGDFSDYRPVAQAAARAFLDCSVFPPGPWDELSLWLGLPIPPASEQQAEAKKLQPLPESPAVHRLNNGSSWATLRVVRYKGRPSHADQLHVDLWWDGENIALDAGTYRYTAAPPWDNSLAGTAVHNTILVNGQDQMQRAGRFLWLDWAQARMLDTHTLPPGAIAAQQDGYLRLGILHRRILRAAGPDRWLVIDHLLSGQELPSDMAQRPLFSYRLHWLLPDWPWSLERSTLTLARPAGGKVRLTLTPEIPLSPISQIEHISLIRAGRALAGPKTVSPIAGWYSPTYHQKIPALSFSIQVRSSIPFSLVSDWELEA